MCKGGSEDNASSGCHQEKLFFCSLPRSALTTLVTSFTMSRSTSVTLLWQVYHSMNWTGCSLSSMRLLASRQMPANTTTWHTSWWTYTGCGYHNASSISCVCWCTAAWMEQCQDTCPTWQCLSPVLHVVGSVQHQPPIWWCHQLVAHPSETVRYWFVATCNN